MASIKLVAFLVSIFIILENGSGLPVDGSENNFQLTAESCVEPIYMSGVGGGFITPNYPNGYRPNMLCDWFITGLRGTRIEIFFFAIRTEMDRDEVIIRDGFQSDSPIFFRFSGLAENVTVESSTTEIHVSFQSDAETEFEGISLTWKSI